MIQNILQLSLENKALWLIKAVIEVPDCSSLHYLTLIVIPFSKSS